MYLGLLPACCRLKDVLWVSVGQKDVLWVAAGQKDVLWVTADQKDVLRVTCRAERENLRLWLCTFSDKTYLSAVTQRCGVSGGGWGVEWPVGY